jgi:hypothetical protein
VTLVSPRKEGKYREIVQRHDLFASLRNQDTDVLSRKNIKTLGKHARTTLE